MLTLQMQNYKQSAPRMEPTALALCMACTWEEQGAIVVEGWGQQLKRGASRRGTALETIVFVNWCWDEWSPPRGKERATNTRV